VKTCRQKSSTSIVAYFCRVSWIRLHGWIILWLLLLLMQQAVG